MSGGELSARWRHPAGAGLAAQVIDRLATGQPLDGLPLGTHDGRVDLRGIAVPAATVVGTGHLSGDDPVPGEMRWLNGLPTLHGRTLADLDLSGSRLGHLRLHDTVLRNCRFDRADCRDWRAWRLTAERCSFVGADLRDAALGTWYDGRGNTFTEIDFSAADLRGITCQGASFVDCELTGARLVKVEFGACRFLRCRFGGLLDRVAFRADLSVVGRGKPPPGHLSDVDFTAATLRWVEFRGVSLDQVRLPAEGDAHAVVEHYPCVVRRLVADLADRREPHAQGLYIRMLTEAQRLDTARTTGIWHLDELGRTPAHRRLARELLHAAERACAETTEEPAPVQTTQGPAPEADTSRSGR